MPWTPLKADLLAKSAWKMPEAPCFVELRGSREGELVPVFGIELRDGKAVIVLPGE